MDHDILDLRRGSVSWHIELGPRTIYPRQNDMNFGRFKTAKGSYAYGRPPLPPGSTELPQWLLDSLAKMNWG